MQRDNRLPKDENEEQRDFPTTPVHNSLYQTSGHRRPIASGTNLNGIGRGAP